MFQLEYKLILLLLILIASVFIWYFIDVLKGNKYEDFEDFEEASNTTESDKNKTVVTFRDWLKDTPLPDIHIPIYKDLWTIQNDVIRGIAADIAADNNTNEIDQFIPKAVDQVRNEINMMPLACTPVDINTLMSSNESFLKSGKALKFLECFPTSQMDWILLTNFFVGKIVDAAKIATETMSGNFTPPAVSTANTSGASSKETVETFISNLSNLMSDSSDKTCCAPDAAAINFALQSRINALKDLSVVEKIRIQLRKGLDAKKTIDKIKGSAADDTIGELVSIDADAAASASSSATNAAKNKQESFLNFNMWKY